MTGGRLRRLQAHAVLTANQEVIAERERRISVGTQRYVSHHKRENDRPIRP